MIDTFAKAEEALKNEIHTRNFESFALDLFRLQAQHVPIYGAFVSQLGIDYASITSIQDIPFMPVSFFKSHKVLAKGFDTELVFETSGTTAQSPGRHFVPKASLYDWSYNVCYKGFTNNESYALLALLPNYLERGNSSLVYMVDGLIQATRDADSGFFLNEFETIAAILKRREAKQQKTLLWGVTYALLDFCETHPMNLKHTRVLETGGMKGRRKEMVKEELHEILKKGFGVSRIYSEYGMTELLSQAYSHGENRFTCPAHMAVVLRDTSDPLSTVPLGVTGGINIIDLANIYSCAFIATEDLGKLHSDGTFEVLGRFDAAEVRGCNLMVQ